VSINTVVDFFYNGMLFAISTLLRLTLHQVSARGHRACRHGHRRRRRKQAVGGQPRHRFTCFFWFLIVIAKVQSDIQEEEAAAAAELAAARSKARDLEQQVHTQFPVSPTLRALACCKMQLVSLSDIAKDDAPLFRLSTFIRK
jgi:hypothetical protein